MLYYYFLIWKINVNLSSNKKFSATYLINQNYGLYGHSSSPMSEPTKCV